jgi:basic membrane protein A and related proteins
MRLFLVAAVAAALIVFAGCGGDDSSNGAADSGSDGQKKVKLAAIFTNSLEGSEYNQIHLESIENAIDELGADRFELKTVYDIPFTPRVTQTTQQLFSQGSDVVLDTMVAGPLFFDACKKVPTKKCLGYVEYFDEGTQHAPNLRSVNQDQALIYYPLGVAAGHLTKSGTIGMVGTFPAPFQLALTNAYALGCQSVRPDCKVRNVYLNAFLDPPKAAEATNTLIDSGADVIAHFHDQNTPVSVAEKRGVYGFGHAVDEAEKFPKAWVSGDDYVRGLTAAYTEAFGRLLDESKWQPGGMDWGGPAPNIDLASFGPDVPAEAKEAAEAALEGLRDGSVNPYSGPIYDTKGKLRIKEGEELDIRSKEVNHPEWYVKGVIGG